MHSILENEQNIFLISYPKSGTVWVKNILVNMLLPEDTLEKYRHIDELIPAINHVN